MNLLELTSFYPNFYIRILPCAISSQRCVSIKTSTAAASPLFIFQASSKQRSCLRVIFRCRSNFLSLPHLFSLVKNFFELFSKIFRRGRDLVFSGRIISAPTYLAINDFLSAKYSRIFRPYKTELYQFITLILLCQVPFSYFFFVFPFLFILYYRTDFNIHLVVIFNNYPRIYFA